MTTQMQADQDAIAARRREFDAVMTWLYDHGARHIDTVKVGKNITLKTYTFAGEVLIIQEIVAHGGVNWEFFMPLTGDGTWKGTLAALQSRLEANQE